MLTDQPLGEPGAQRSQLGLRDRRALRRFQRLYYDSAQTWQTTSWMGIPTQKCPTDMWIYQEILFEVKPDLLIETGTAYGGSALFFAHIMDLMGKGRVTTVDILDTGQRPTHPRITYVQSSSTDPETFTRLRQGASESGCVMVVLDSDHSAAHVARELELYADLVTPGSYLVVEDTNVNGHPVYSSFGPGPMEAVEEFLEKRSDFAVDPVRERLYMTFNPRGFLKKVGPS